jgi:hypothetical protein
VEPQYEDYFASAFRGEIDPSEWHDIPPEELNRYLRELIAGVNERLVAERGVRLRPDAQLFLLLNFRELIARPLDARGPTDVRGELRGGLEHDIWTVADAAAEEAEEPEVSGHQVVNALSSTWYRMVTLRWGIWDRER